MFNGMLTAHSKDSDGDRQDQFPAIEPETFFIAFGVLIVADIIGNALTANGIIIRLLEIVLLIQVMRIWGNGLSSIGLGRHQLYPGLMRGIIWSLGFGAVVTLGFGLIFLFGINPFALIHARLPKDFGGLIYFLILAGVIGPIAEEVFFRGILYGFLRRWGIITALCLSTLTFVLLHSSAGITQIAGGILFAAAYETEKKLMTPIFIHILGNMAIFMISIF